MLTRNCEMEFVNMKELRTELTKWKQKLFKNVEPKLRNEIKIMLFRNEMKQTMNCDMLSERVQEC